MELRARTRPIPRRAATMAAVGAIIASAAAGAAAPEAGAKQKAKPPVVTAIEPSSVAVGQTLQIRGRHFVRGRLKNTVAFKRDSGKAVFVKAEVATRKLIRVTIPERLTEQMAIRDGSPIPTPFRIRVLAKRFGEKFTSGRLIPLVGPELPPAPDKPAVDPDGDCDSDGTANKVDTDDDNDLLLDTREKQLTYPLDPCDFDTDGDGVGDGYEFRSARDLNNDEYQNLNTFLPFPGKMPYPNPLDAEDAGVDYDGDALTLAEEHSLWKLTVASGSSSPTPEALDAAPAALSYSDGMQFSIYTQPHGDDRRAPALSAVGYGKELDFKAWLNASGYWNIHRVDDGAVTPILDFNRDGVVSETTLPGYESSEAHYLDIDGNGWLTDDERDEDADGLSNFDESHGRMQPAWWSSIYPREKPFRIAYGGTKIDDADTDGDGVRDGADDQDHDDVPNVVELSRKAVVPGSRPFDPADLKVDLGDPSPVYGRVQPFNPCLPFVDSRTCPLYVPTTNVYAPFDGPPWMPKGEDPNYLVLN